MVILARREEKAVSPYLARRPGSGGRRQLRSAPGVQGVPGGDQPQHGEKLGCSGFAALCPEPASRQRQCRAPRLGNSLSAPGGGALEIRFALPTRPLSGAKARGWVLDLDLQVRTVSGRLMETYFKSCWGQKMYSWEEAGKIKATQRLKGQALSEAEGAWRGGGAGSPSSLGL